MLIDKVDSRGRATFQQHARRLEPWEGFAASKEWGGICLGSDGRQGAGRESPGQESDSCRHKFHAIKSASFCRGVLENPFWAAMGSLHFLTKLVAAQRSYRPAQVK